MSGYNKGWNVKGSLYDFYARSLYPSALTILGIPLLGSKVLKDNRYEFMRKQDYYFNIIINSKNGKHRAFPSIAERTKDGVNWNHPVALPYTTTVDKTTLED